LSFGQDVQKRLNGSTSCLGWIFLETQEILYYMAISILHGEGGGGIGCRVILSDFVEYLVVFATQCSAVHWCGICYGDGVCLSITLMYCAQTTESIIMRPSPDCSPDILVLPRPNMNLTARGDTPH